MDQKNLIRIKVMDFITFLMVVALSEIQIASSKSWMRFLESISDDDDRYDSYASFNGCLWYDIKWHPVARLHFWRFGKDRITPSLLWLPGPLENSVVVPVKVKSIG